MPWRVAGLAYVQSGNGTSTRWSWPNARSDYRRSSFLKQPPRRGTIPGALGICLIHQNEGTSCIRDCPNCFELVLPNSFGTGDLVTVRQTLEAFLEHHGDHKSRCSYDQTGKRVQISAHVTHMRLITLVFFIFYVNMDGNYAQKSSGALPFMRGTLRIAVTNHTVHQQLLEVQGAITAR